MLSSTTINQATKIDPNSTKVAILSSGVGGSVGQVGRSDRSDRSVVGCSEPVENETITIFQAVHGRTMLNLGMI